MLKEYREFLIKGLPNKNNTAKSINPPTLELAMELVRDEEIENIDYDVFQCDGNVNKQINNTSNIQYRNNINNYNSAERNGNLIHKFVIVDFEFFMINDTNMVLISGAISNSLDRFKVRTLAGRPLLLPLNEEVRPMSDQELNAAMSKIKRTLKYKTELRDACLDQLSKYLETTVNSLTSVYIENYILKSDSINALVVWNGYSNKNILNRLGIKQFPILNITCYDKFFTQTFLIQLEKIQTKEVIFEVEIGKFIKTSRQMNLEEAHNIICSKKHKFKYANDPLTKVKFTKCVFDFVIRKQGYDNLTKHLN